jgi:hypothetical protein
VHGTTTRLAGSFGACERRFVFASADILTGLAVLVLFIVADSLSQAGADFRAAVLALAQLCLAAGLLRRCSMNDASAAATMGSVAFIMNLVRMEERE